MKSAYALPVVRLTDVLFIYFYFINLFLSSGYCFSEKKNSPTHVFVYSDVPVEIDIFPSKSGRQAHKKNIPVRVRRHNDEAAW